MAKDNPFDPDLVRELANLIADTGLTEIEVEKGDLRIRVARNVAAAVTVPVAAPRPRRLPAAAPRRPSATAARRATVAPAATHPGAVPSPMVGTAYLLARARTPSPSSRSARKVEAGDTLLHHRGDEDDEPDPARRAPARSPQILVEDAQPVEFGEPLVVIE